MSLLGRLNDLISGQPAGTSDGIAATDAAVLAQQQQITADKAAAGDYTPEQLALINADYASQPTNSVTDQAAQIDTAFASGLGDAAAHPVDSFANGLAWEGNAAGSVVKTVSSGIGSGLKGLLGGVPFWLWVVGALALFLWLGGGGFVTRRARGALSK